MVNANATPHSNSTGTWTVHFMTLPDYSASALTSAIDALRLANRVLEREAYAWRLVSEFDEAVIASNGLSLSPTLALDDAGRPDMLVVCGGPNVRKHVTRWVVGVLQRLAADAVALGGLASGGYALAQAGLLDAYTAVVQRGEDDERSADFPAVLESAAPWAVDRDRHTATGAAAADLMQQLVVQQHGQGVGLAMTKARQGSSVQPATQEQASQAEPDPQREHLIRAAELMEAHIGNPLSIDELAHHVGVSRRQLERLFRRHLGTVPSRYYMGVRLRHARTLVQGTTSPMAEIGTICGFESAAHFTRCYRTYFSKTPTLDRQTASVKNVAVGAES